MMYLHGRGGFTLIECLVAILIIGIGVIGVAGMFTCASLSEQKATYMAQARQAAEDALENARAGAYPVFSEPSGVVDIPTPGLPRATGQLAWEPYSSAAGESLKTVALNINWDWTGTTSGKYWVTTLVASGGGS